MAQGRHVMGLRVHAYGGPEALSWERLEVGRPGPGEVRLRHRAVGVNFLDIYQRRGLYPVPLPAVLGSEAVGEVLEVGPGVALRPGERVAYVTGPGAYAEERLATAQALVPLPEELDDVSAAAVLFKGTTAEFLVRRVHRVEAGQVVLLDAAAGGVGLLLAQWARALGARVIGVVSREAKAEAARAAGCAEVLVGLEDLGPRVRALTGGRGADVAYESIGGEALAGAIDALRPRGLLVSFGQASGEVPRVDLGLLGAKALYLTRPTTRVYLATGDDVRQSAAAVFEGLRAGWLRPRLHATFPLREAARAHQALESRQTVGAVVLTV